MRSKQRLYLQKLVELLDGIMISPVRGVILTPKKRRQLAELRKIKIGQKRRRIKTKNPYQKRST